MFNKHIQMKYLFAFLAKNVNA